MYFEEENSKGTFKFLSGLAIGALLGAGIALMVAPQSGKRTRRKMIRQVVTGRRNLGAKVGDWTDDLGTALRRRGQRKRRFI